jgi:hypothetical protein
MPALPQIRGNERMDYKRCQHKWYWRWRRGLVPKAVRFGALDLGNWVHDGLAGWYGSDIGGRKRVGNLAEHVTNAAQMAVESAMSQGAPDYVLDEASELTALAEAMAQGYERHYGRDPDVYVLATEIPLEVVITDYDDKPVVLHKLKPDLVFSNVHGVWLMEHKTAGQIVTGHLPLDDQARPYGSMAERALRKIGLIGDHQEFKGIMYNFLRKAFPDERERNAEGKALNKNGTVSKRQPAANFLRHPSKLTKLSKAKTLRRVRLESVEIAGVAEALRSGRVTHNELHKTPTKGCERFCEFFSICKMDEEGTDTAHAERLMFTRRDPYVYDEDNPTTEEHKGFEGL